MDLRAGGQARVDRDAKENGAYLSPRGIAPPDAHRIRSGDAEIGRIAVTGVGQRASSIVRDVTTLSVSDGSREIGDSGGQRVGHNHIEAGSRTLVRPPDDVRDHLTHARILGRGGLDNLQRGRGHGGHVGAHVGDVAVKARGRGHRDRGDLTVGRTGGSRHLHDEGDELVGLQRLRCDGIVRCNLLGVQDAVVIEILIDDGRPARGHAGDGQIKDVFPVADVGNVGVKERSPSRREVLRFVSGRKVHAGDLRHNGGHLVGPYCGQVVAVGILVVRRGNVPDDGAGRGPRSQDVAGRHQKRERHHRDDPPPAGFE